MIFDNRWVLTASFNFTRASNSKNVENLLLIDDLSLAQIYKKNWKNRAEGAKKFLDSCFKESNFIEKAYGIVIDLFFFLNTL